MTFDLPRPLICSRILIPSVAALAVVAASFGHPDDPKGKSILPPYVGPGYRANADEGGVAGVPTFPANDVSLLSWLPVQEFGFQMQWGNDCWGYTAPSGREYAIIGLSDGTGFVEITDPGNAQVVEVIDGPFSTWRDIKTYQSYAYAVSEGGGGIQVMDLGNIDDDQAITRVSLVNQVEAGGTGATHNVAINEESGFLYRTGGGSNGLRIYDLSNPASPTFVGSWPDRYIHDAQIVSYTDGPYAGKEIAFCCSGLNGGSVETGIDILDVTDKQNIEVMANYQYPNGAYSHQGWLSEDRQYFFLNDEADETSFGLSSTMHIIDVSDLNNPIQATTYTNFTTAITHNLYVRDNLVYAANYSSGMRVFDVTEPLSPIEVAFFDTAPDDSSANFNSLWSVYPYFPSGTVIGSDRQRGLFVWNVGGPSVSFDYPQSRPEWINAAGDSFPVQVAVDEGVLVPDSATLTYDIGDGPVTVPVADQGDGLYEITFPAVECVTELSWYLSIETEDGLQWHDPVVAPFAGHQLFTAEGEQLAFVDDFELDQGWTVENSPELVAGAWERGVPSGDGDRGDPSADADGSGQAFLTQNGPGDTDVDGGATTLTSPVMDASGDDVVAYLSYARWYSNNAGSNPGEDTFLIEVSNDGGDSWSVLEDIDINYGKWRLEFFRLDQVIEPTAQMQVRFNASDLNGGSVVEAGVDQVRLIFYECEEAPGGPSADINGDGLVNVLDLIEVITNWGECAAPCPADIDGSGAVDVNDLVEVIVAWTGA